MTVARLHNQWLIALELVALLLVVGVSAWLFPAIQAVQMTAALAVAYVVPRWLYHRGHHASPVGHAVLLVAALWLAAIALPCVWSATVGSGASFAMPQLHGDASDYYDWALAHYDGSAVEPKVTFWGYSIMILALWHVLGVSIIWPVAANVMATLITIVMAGKLAARLVKSDNKRAATLTMALLTVMGYFMSQGAQMLKEPWVYLAITLIAHGLCPNRNCNRALCIMHCALIYALGCLILAAVRAKYINFLFIGIVMMMLADSSPQPHLKRGVSRVAVSLHSTLFRGGWGALMLAITLACWLLGMAMTDHYTVIQQVNNVTGQGGMSWIFAPQGVYQQLLGDYFHYPAWKKLLCLPLTCGVQWIIPFPWLPEGHSATWLSIAPRLRLGWYVVSGVVLYFYLFRSWRRGWLWVAWAWFPMVCYAGIAYMTAGTVSRYILAFQPWWMALAAVTLLTCWRQRNFRLFMLAYLAAITTTLIICHFL